MPEKFLPRNDRAFRVKSSILSKGKNNMKKITKWILSALMLLVAMSVLPACEKKSKVEEIFISKNGQPQTVYVVGQELNLENGSLTVIGGSTETEIALSDGSITVDGYDKDSLGSQELTVSYKGKTTTLTVKVVQRIVAENYEKEYFVGESFNSKKGQLVITKDDGTNFRVNISDSGVTLGTMNSAQASASVPVSVTYAKNDVRYDGTIETVVYEVDKEKSSLSKPRDVVYQSYEDTFSVSGCYLTLRSFDGKLERYIAVTEDMISGFDPTQATKDHKESPLSQTITVNYVGNIFTFNISVYYSDVTEIRKIAEELSVIDWTGKEMPAVSKELGEKALSAANMYFGLNDTEKDVLTETEKETVMRAATVYGYDLWSNSAQSYENVFKPNGAGGIEIVAENVEAVNKARTSVVADDKKLAEYTTTMQSIVSEFKDVVLYGETTIGTHLKTVYSNTIVQALPTVLGMMIDLESALKNVPADWTEDKIENYSASIEKATATIEAAKTSSEFRSAYKVVSSWREEDDYFDILYTYYYRLIVKDGAKDEEISKGEKGLEALQNKYLPGRLETLYETSIDALRYSTYLSVYVMETTTYYRTFLDAMQLMNSVAASDDPMEKYFYKNLTFNEVLKNASTGAPIEASFTDIVLNARKKGLFSRMQTSIENTFSSSVWSSFVNILEKSETDGYEGTEEYKKDVEALWELFVAGSPADQRAFLLSLNNGYSGETTKLVLDYADGSRSSFVDLFKTYYTDEENGVLSAEVRKIFQDVLLAIENFSLRYDRDEALNNFADIFKKIETAYAGYGETDKANFDKYLGSFREKYKKIVEYFGTEDITDMPTEWTEVMNEMTTELLRVLEAYQLIKDEKAYYSLLFSTYEHASSLAEKLTAKDVPEKVKNFYYYTPINLFSKTDSDGNTTKLYWSLDYSLYQMRVLFVNTYLGLSTGNNQLFDLYSNKTELHAYFSDISDFISMSYYNSVATQENQKEYKEEDVKKAIDGFFDLTTDEQYIFLAIDGSKDLYSNGLIGYFKNIFSKNANIVLENALIMQEKYIYYDLMKTTSDAEKYLKEFKEAYEYYLEKFQELEEADAEAFAGYFKTLHEFYTEKYEKCESSSQN